MRDIRGDLQDRASFLEEQIITAEAQFEKHVGQLRREHEIKVEDLKDELGAVTTLIEVELRRLTSAAPVQDEQRRPAPQPEAEHQRRLAPEAEHYRRPVASEAEYQRRPAPEAEHPRHLAAETEQQRRPAPDSDRHYRAAVSDAEPYRRPAPEAEHRPRPAPEPEQQRRPEPEPYRRPVAAQAEPQRRPEAEPQRHPAPVARSEIEQDRRPVAPQVYRQPAPTASAPETEQRRPVAQAVQSQPQPLADFLLRKLGEIGAMTFDDLCHHAAQEGYFANGEISDRGVHVTLMNVVKAGFIRQLPNGTFAPATVMDTIRLRRAI